MAAACAVVLIGAAPAGAARPKQKPAAKCPPKHSFLMMAGTEAEVYLRPEGSGPFGFEAEEIFGCVYGHSRVYDLGAPSFGPSGPSGSGGIVPKALHGAIVAYEASGTRQVLVRNLRNGNVLYEVPTNEAAANSSLLRSESDGRGPAVSVVLKTDGSVAWINEFGLVVNKFGTVHPMEYEVHAVDKNGSRVLGSGTNVDPHSLALAGSTLYWTQDGSPMSTVLN